MPSNLKWVGHAWKLALLDQPRAEAFTVDLAYLLSLVASDPWSSTTQKLRHPLSLRFNHSQRLTSNAQRAMNGPPLPPKHGNWVTRNLRFQLFPAFRRIVSVILLINLIGLVLVLCKPNIDGVASDQLATWASSNFLVAIFVRQDFFINTLYRSAWMVPWSVPLCVRRVVARIYVYGGLHSGTAMAGTMWFIFLTVVSTIRFARDRSYAPAAVIVTWVILTLLLVILILASGPLRFRFHNSFEITHRFLGWSSILLFWAQLLLLTQHTHQTSNTPFATLLIHQPTLWILTLTTALIIHPWLYLSRWTFTPHKLSSHAMRLHFTNPVHRFSCLALSTNPLREWHPFATFPSTDPAEPGTSLIVSAAGDWTRALINCPSPRTTYWVKGFPKAGVLSLTCIFRRVVIVTTGSGIGPSMASLLERPAGQFIRLVWSARAPRATYGKELVKLVERQDPGAVVMDSSREGRLNLREVAYQVQKEVEAEAVFVLSNKEVTKWLVYGLESRGVKVYGPIFDS
ncbi:hypothetical protein EJ04DRAFT_535815 [Polyplosphaeria fusca]|uniref:Nonribosomal peptide synthetase 12 n=1 Tax=Polyplosphaeria fusca TaxID=682080 RepID=A0A9P4UY83_9PLEO|nr:hypothetical protein EJ04DRAFT_535815 [Polyplosphaeria fusca]